MSEGERRSRVRLTPPPRVGPSGDEAGVRVKPERSRRTPRILAGALYLAVLAVAGWLLLAGPWPGGDAPAVPADLPLEDPAGAAAPPPRVQASQPTPTPPEAAVAAEEARPPGAADDPREDGPEPSRAAASPRSEAPAAPPAPPPDPAVLELAKLRDLEALAKRREAEEAWTAAVAAYRAALEIEPTAAFAQAGLRRAGSRADLAARLDGHLARPGRLAADTVLEEARELLEMAAAVESPGPRHQSQVEALRALVAEAEVAVEVELVSDGLTEVAIHHVGRLGRFTRRELELRPGEYTVVGTRRGYRDVRLTLVVSAGAAPEPLIVRCREPV
ncbi:MAG: hypothetical protein R3325_11050 [Thermoanaerobaculia bacterium]|nr:hypothetical protein [Thermoanaerobaculia bacterium]